jgi:hypothetical protein
MQNKVQGYLVAGLSAMILLSFTIFSFSVPGGDHFEIYLNKKLILQDFVSQNASVKTVALDQQNVNDEVNIYYSHCGKLGSKRTIVIKDGKNVLKQWRFSDVGSKKFMSFGAKELLSFQSKNGDKKLNLVYSSEQLPEGRLLATIFLDTETVQKVIP